MSGLIYKEFVLQKRSLLIMAAAVLLLCALLFFPAGSDYLYTLSNSFSIEPKYLVMVWEMVIYLILFLLVGMYQPTIFEADENKKWAGFVTASPLTGDGQVGAKYYFTLFLSVMILAVCWFFDFVTAVVYHGDFSFLNMAVILFYIQLLLRAFEYPYIVRFGSKNGGTYKGILFLIVVLAVILYFLFGDLSAFGSINGMLDGLFRLITGETSSGGLILLQGLLPYISLALYYLSYRISCNFYLKGVETYDK